MDSRREFKKIEDWLKSVDRKNTKKQYRSAIYLFFEHYKSSPDDFLKDKTDNELKEAIRRYYVYRKNNTEFGPSSVSIFKSALAGFLFDMYHVDLGDLFWKRTIKRTSNGGRARRYAPTREMLKVIMQYCKDPLERAFFLIMSSSGIRPKELTHISFDDINLDANPVEIRVPASVAKNKLERYTFISPEATSALKEWLKHRDEYIERKQLQCKPLVDYVHKKYGKTQKVTKERLFPYHEGYIGKKWNQCLVKAGFTEKNRNGIYKYHLYTLRYYFSTQLKGKMNDEYKEFIMGHSGYLFGIYDDYFQKDLKEAIKKDYLKNHQHLLVYELPVNQEAIDELKKELENYSIRINELEQNKIVEGMYKPVEINKNPTDLELTYKSKTIAYDVVQEKKDIQKIEDYQNMLQQFSKDHANKMWKLLYRENPPKVDS